MSQIFQKQFDQVFRVRNAPVVLSGKQNAFFFNGFFQSDAVFHPFHNAVLLFQVGVPFGPAVFEAVQFAVVLEHFAVEGAPGAKHIIFFVDAAPILKFLDDFREMSGAVDVFLDNAGEVFAKDGERGMGHGFYKAVEFAAHFAIAVEFKSADFDGFLDKVGRGDVPAGGFEVVYDVIHKVQIYVGVLQEALTLREKFGDCCRPDIDHEKRFKDLADKIFTFFWN
jgi:hypothetical protein